MDGDIWLTRVTDGRAVVLTQDSDSRGSGTMYCAPSWSDWIKLQDFSTPYADLLLVPRVSRIALIGMLSSPHTDRSLLVSPPHTDFGLLTSLLTLDLSCPHLLH